MTITIAKISDTIAENGYNITEGNARITVLLNMDFPGEYNKKTRGEIWYIEVPESLRKKGVGLKLCEKAISFMKSKGMKTVNMSPTSKEGRALIISLIHNGYISKPIKQSQSGKMEFKIL